MIFTTQDIYEKDSKRVLKLGVGFRVGMQWDGGGVGDAKQGAAAAAAAASSSYSSSSLMLLCRIQTWHHLQISSLMNSHNPNAVSLPVLLIFLQLLPQPIAAMSSLHLRAATSAVLSHAPLGFPFKTLSPFLFCVYHHDNYPAGDALMQAPRKGNGADFDWSQP